MSNEIIKAVMKDHNCSKQEAIWMLEDLDDAMDDDRINMLDKVFA